MDCPVSQRQFVTKPALWSDDERRLVRRMLADGATARVIAAEFGISRNAAIGRVRRDPDLALNPYHGRALKKPRPAKAKPASFFKPSRQEVPSKPRGKSAIASVTGDVVHSLPVPSPPRPSPPEKTHPMALIGTGRRWCKWPVAISKGTLGGFLCCGAQATAFDVYCPYHRYVAGRGAE